MDVQKFEEEQIRLGQELRLPRADVHFAQQDLVFTIDVHYEARVAYVAVDIQTFAGDSVVTRVTRYESSSDYRAGVFALKEGHLILRAIDDAKVSGFVPSLVIVDGHGTAHPRKFGLACWVGEKLGVPTIGVAKRPLIGRDVSVANRAGSRAKVLVDGRVVGFVLRTRTGVKPVYVSAGYGISQDQSVQIIRSLVGSYRIIEPMRRADSAARSKVCTK